MSTPPSITPQQMNLLRIVAAMAWADGQLEAQEVEVMLANLSRLFAISEAHQAQLQLELKQYLQQSYPLAALIPQLSTQAEKELVLKLGYQVISCSARTPNEPKVNVDEATAYQRLVELLNLPEETVQRLEAEAISELGQGMTIVEAVTRRMELFSRGH